LDRSPIPTSSTAHLDDRAERFCSLISEPIKRHDLSPSTSRENGNTMPRTAGAWRLADQIRASPDVAIFSFGNVLTLIVVCILVFAFAFWVFKCPDRIASAQKARRKRRGVNGQSISKPLTPPQGSILGEWDEELKSSRSIGDLESQSGGYDEPSRYSTASETLALLPPAPQAHIVTHHKTRPSLTLPPPLESQRR